MARIFESKTPCKISQTKHSHENVWQLIFWCEGLEWTIAGQARHLPPGVVLNSASRREAKRGQSTNRKGEMSRASH